MKHKSISLSTFTRFLTPLTTAVETKISKQLSVKFALVFEGSTSNSSHYVASYASSPPNNRSGFISRLLSVYSIGDECQLESDQHIEYFDYVLSLYGKSTDNVVAIVGDNPSVNESIFGKTGIPFIGFASHLFNVAVGDILERDKILVSEVQSIMAKLRPLLLSANL